MLRSSILKEYNDSFEKLAEDMLLFIGKTKRVAKKDFVEFANRFARLKYCQEDSIEDIAVWLMYAMEAQGNYETSQDSAKKIACEYAKIARDRLKALGVDV